MSADEGPGSEPTTTSALRRGTTAAALLLVLAAVVVFGPGELPPEGSHMGMWSLLPALTTLLLVFVTREVISSLFAGVVVGGLVSGHWNLIDAFLIPAIGSESYATILLVYLWALGGLIGLWTRTGGAQRLRRGRRARHRARTALGSVLRLADGHGLPPGRHHLAPSWPAPPCGRSPTRSASRTRS